MLSCFLQVALGRRVLDSSLAVWQAPPACLLWYTSCPGLECSWAPNLKLRTVCKILLEPLVQG